MILISAWCFRTRKCFWKEACVGDDGGDAVMMIRQMVLFAGGETLLLA